MKTQPLITLFLACIVAITMTASCGTRQHDSLSAKTVEYPPTTFMVITDTHFYDPALGVSGPAWDAYMRNDRKLLAEGKETLEFIIERILAKHPDFLIVTGDLTKDGEESGHRQFAEYLRRLHEAGIKTFVVPGNHDINNPNAARYTASGSERLPGLTAAQFAEIYAEDGYASAVSRDPDSLSYVAEPVEGLWLLAIDSNKYANNAYLGYPETSGKVKKETMNWIKGVLEHAHAKGKAVIAMEHHPIMEHIYDMKSKYGEYILDNGKELSALLAENDVRYIFTGHFHANSIVKKTYGDRYIIDVETNSPVTWPCAFRTVQFMDNGSATFTSDRVAQLDSFKAANRDFDKEGYEIIARGLKNIATDTMKKYSVPDEDCAKLTDGIIAAMMAHYAGDATFTGRDVLDEEHLSLPGKLVVNSYKPFIEGLWKIRPPKGIELMSDNNLTIHRDGSEERP